MNLGHNKNIVIPEICVRNNVAFVTCKISKYKDIIKRLEVGEYLTTTHPFDIHFPDFTSKWTIFLFPRGQYDYGIASRNIRVYIKNLSYKKPSYKQTLKINICIKSSVTEYSSNTEEFAFNDSNYQCVGPFQIDSINEDELLEDFYIYFTFELTRTPECESSNISKKRLWSNVFVPKGRSKQVERSCSPQKFVSSSKARAIVNTTLSKSEAELVKQKISSSVDGDRKNQSEKSFKQIDLSEKMSLQIQPQCQTRRSIFSSEARTQMQDKYIRNTTSNKDLN